MFIFAARPVLLIIFQHQELNNQHMEVGCGMDSWRNSILTVCANGAPIMVDQEKMSAGNVQLISITMYFLAGLHLLSTIFPLPMLFNQYMVVEVVMHFWLNLIRADKEYGALIMVVPEMRTEKVCALI